jgi:hypothetical protein
MQREGDVLRSISVSRSDLRANIARKHIFFSVFNSLITRSISWHNEIDRFTRHCILQKQVGNHQRLPASQSVISQKSVVVSERPVISTEESGPRLWLSSHRRVAFGHHLSTPLPSHVRSVYHWIVSSSLASCVCTSGRPGNEIYIGVDLSLEYSFSSSSSTHSINDEH